MTDTQLMEWLRKHNAGVRFESDQTVSVWVNGTRRRRPCLGEAVTAIIGALK